MLTADLAYLTSLEDVLQRPLTAEIRKATDLTPRTAALERFIKSVLAEAKRGGTSSAVADAKQAQNATNENALPLPATMSPWLVDTIEIIETHRRVLSSLNANARDTQIKTLATAEMLASFLADVTPRRRPQLSIDDEGRPSFASALQDFYFHLTVDAPGLLTWFARVRGVEHFDEGVAFGGRSFPPQLKQIFAA
jgi:hypothetical protein